MTGLVDSGVRLDLGPGRYMESVMDYNDRLIGWLHTHPDARGAVVPCQSFCAVRTLDGSQVYEITRDDPLTLTPSLRCPTCGDHGIVVDGKWEPA